MAELGTYDLPDLVNVEVDSGVQGGRPWTCHKTIVPGSFVHHKEDPNSYGTCLSRRWGPNDKPMQCEVLWSRQPKLIQVNVQSVPIQAQSRKLNAKWSAEQASDLYAHGMISKSFVMKEVFELEEEYENLSYEEVQKFHEDGADIQLHSDGRATVKRKTHEPPPRDILADGRIRNAKVTKRW